jgi:hypothetical protein
VLFPRSINSSSNPTPHSPHQLSDRIQARAVRRMGELIKTFNNERARTDLDDGAVTQRLPLRQRRHKGYVLGPDGGDHLVHFRNPGNIFSSGNLALRTQQVPVGAGIPIHRHFEYDKAQQFMVVQLRSAYYPYCEMPSAIGRVSAPKRTFLAPGVGARSRTRPVATRRECVAQHWPPVPPRGHCECRMEVFVSLRGFSTAQ